MTTKITGGRLNRGGFKLGSGTIKIGSNWNNEGIVEWEAGTISDGTLNNQSGAVLKLSPGSGKRELKATLKNAKGGKNSPGGKIEQKVSLSIEPGPGEVLNAGVHELSPGASISGPASLAYTNLGTFRVLDGVSTLVSVGFDNSSTGSVEVGAKSTLTLPQLTNLDADGILTGGVYWIHPQGQLLLARSIKTIKDGLWSGPGGPTVTSLCGPFSKFFKTTSETHAAPLVAEDGATLDLCKDTTTTVPKVELKGAARIQGEGQLKGDLDIQWGTVAPGNSPGTLTITGNVTFSDLATYEWEAASATSSDVLAISTPTVLAGIVQPRLLDGYLPDVRDSFTILTAPSVSGTFDFVDQSFLPPGLTLSLDYTANSVTLTFADAAVDTFDAWRQTRFSPAELLDPSVSGFDADPDGDGLTNAAEFAHGLTPRQRRSIR